MQKIFGLVMALSASGLSIAQDGNRGGVGYPTVDAALAALKARGDVSISAQGGWTIVEDKAARTFWSFAPDGHPAYPAVVKRTVVERDGGVSIDMRALCQAQKSECDKLIDAFKALNARTAQAITATSGSAGATAALGWTASAAQVRAVEQRSLSYFAAKDSQRFQDAYDMQAPTLRQLGVYESWRRDAADTAVRLGPPLNRAIKKITWYKDPPGNRPGTYAAVDFIATFANAGLACGYLVWTEQLDGGFSLVREEVNFIDKETEKRLTPEERARAAALFKCKS